MAAGKYIRTNQHRKNLRDSIWGDPEKKKATIEKMKLRGGRLKGRKDSCDNTARSLAQKARWERLKADPIKLAERNKKISDSLKGKHTGINSSNWKGGISENRRNSIRSRQLRMKILVRDDYICQICQKRGRNLHIDHIKSWSEYPELRFDPDNCRALCRPCHYYVTFKREIPSGSMWGVSNKLIKKY